MSKERDKRRKKAKRDALRAELAARKKELQRREDIWNLTETQRQVTSRAADVIQQKSESAAIGRFRTRTSTIRAVEELGTLISRMESVTSEHEPDSDERVDDTDGRTLTVKVSRRTGALKLGTK